VRRALTLALLAVLGCAFDGPGRATGEATTLRALPPAQRLDYLREAVVWSPIDTAKLDLRMGPAGGRWRADEILECDFFLPAEEPGGNTPKFLCRTTKGRTYKIKYGRENREVYGEVIGSRLLWALGFRSDRLDPVTVRCHGCPEDPWGFMKSGRDDAPSRDEVRDFAPAVIESYFGTLMESEAEEGVDWDELLAETSRDPARAREQSVHRQALTLLMAFLQHADSKPSQQTLACGPGALVRDAQGAESCRTPELYVGDIGAILGDGWKYTRLSTTKIDYALWKSTPVWRDAQACVVAVNGRPNATLGDVPIAEPARAFLAERLSLLGHAQVRDLFAVARVELIGEMIQPTADASVRSVDADDWAALFIEKQAAITEHRCPDAPAD
jgi:hypothetical protein